MSEQAVSLSSVLTDLCADNEKLDAQFEDEDRGEAVSTDVADFRWLGFSPSRRDRPAVAQDPRPETVPPGCRRLASSA